MIEARRKSVARLLAKKDAPPCENLGQLFYRLPEVVRRHGEDADADHEMRDKVFRSLAGQAPPPMREAYGTAYERWLRLVTRPGSDFEAIEMRTTKPLACGFGIASAFEFGLSLHPLWGLPYIPGSSIKGLVSSYAHHEGDEGWRRAHLAECDADGANALAMFGGLDDRGNHRAGLVSFFDALWVPGIRPKLQSDLPFKEPEEGGPALDILTPHYGKYYIGAKRPPDGQDNPVPFQFLVVPQGIAFLFVLRGPQGWRRLARAILTEALSTCGIGAKTRAGFGRFKEHDLRLPPATPTAPETKERSGGDDKAPGPNAHAAQDRPQIVMIEILGLNKKGRRCAEVVGGGAVQTGLISGNLPPGLTEGDQREAVVLKAVPRQYEFRLIEG